MFVISLQTPALFPLKTRMAPRAFFVNGLFNDVANCSVCSRIAPNSGMRCGKMNRRNTLRKTNTLE